MESKYVPRNVEMAYGTNKFGKEPLPPNMKHVQTNR